MSLPQSTPQEKREYDLVYYSEHRAFILAKGRKYYLRTREARLAHMAEYRVNNREKVRAANKRHMEKYPVKYAYQCHKGRAKARGIEFLFTLEEWTDFWGDNFEFRGRRENELCMGRFDDTGPYKLGNVYICSHGENSAGPRPLPVPNF